MKILKYLLTAIIIISSIIACTNDDSDFNIDDIAAPANVSASVRVTQDNTGLVTISPLGEGVVSYDILFGDGSEPSGTIQPGQSVNHIYEEGSYEITVTATGLNGLTTSITQPIVVSFQAPENLVVTIENDATISKRVNVNAIADFAISYEVAFGEPGNDEPVTANIGETASYTYQEAGTYTITVTAFSAAIETTSYTEEFVVTAILQPLNPAPTPPARAEADVISVYSNAYTNIAGTDFYPNWGQATTFNQINVGGSDIIQYGGLTYQGIQLGTPADASAMEFLHIDVWTADSNDARISPISSGPNETAYDLDLTQDQWTSFDIPLSTFTDQNPLVNLADIIQFKFDGNPVGGTIFVDNLYFYRSSQGTTTSMIEDFEGVQPAFTSFGNIANTEVIANPDPSGINTSATVANLTKTAGSEVWAGTFFEPTVNIDLASYDKISVKTWSPKLNAVVKLKLENQDASIVYEVDRNTTAINTWEELIYDFTAAPVADYVRVVIFFDFGVNGDGSEYYFDEIQLVNEGGGIPPLGFQDFEGTPPAFTAFGNIANVEVIANPDMAGINTTANVASLTKTAGSEVWAGAFFETGSALDLVSYSKISVKTWSPKLGAVVKLKLENQDASIVYEVDLNTTSINTWEELVYDFSGAPSANYVRVVIFFDFGVNGDGSVYYYDELTLTN
jgi:hypothetical protein